MRRSVHERSSPGRGAAWLLAALAIALSGCGDDSSGDPGGAVSASDRATVERAQREIGEYCRQLRLFVLRERPAPTAAKTRTVLDAVEGLAAVAKAKPEAEYRPGQSMRTLLGDMAEDLEGSNCPGPPLERLEQAFASIPAGP